MILAAAWFCRAHCGVRLADGRGDRRSAPDASSSQAVAALVPPTVRYYSRMPVETRLALCAASLALEAAGWRAAAGRGIGILAAGYEGCLHADWSYWEDYVRSGRTNGRSGLFVYTLPSSTAAEVSIAHRLGGPTVHVQADRRALAALVDTAQQMLADGQAEGMIALWSDPQAAVCLAVGPDPPGPVPHPRPVDLDLPPHELAEALAASVRSEG